MLRIVEQLKLIFPLLRKRRRERVRSKDYEVMEMLRGEWEFVLQNLEQCCAACVFRFILWQLLPYREVISICYASVIRGHAEILVNLMLGLEVGE